MFSYRRRADVARRQEQGLLLLEGTHLLQELLQRQLAPAQLLATPAWIARHGDLWGRLPVAVQPVGEEVLAAVASTENPDGVVMSLPAAALPQVQGPADFVLALDQLQDPGNLGTLLRTALAAGVQQVWQGGGADPHQPKVMRSAAGAALALPLARELERNGLIARLEQARAAGHQLVATLVASGPSSPFEPVPYWPLVRTRASVLLLRIEGHGLKQVLDARPRPPVTSAEQS